MPDREKVIKELESLRDICNAKSNMAIGKGKVAWAGYANTADDAIFLLKEQEAVEPGIAQDVDGIFAMCGNCKIKLWKIMGLEFVINPDEMPRFCSHCGKEVKWQ